MMNDTNAKYVNGELLEILLKKARAKIEAKKIRQSERDMYEFFELIIIFLKDDHQKTQLMYAVFVPALWAFGIAAGTLITLAVSGRIEIVIK